MHRLVEHTVKSRLAEGALRRLTAITPIVQVGDLEASIHYYERQLGFSLDWQSPGFASVSRGGCGIFLIEGNPGRTRGWVWVGVSDADVLLREYRHTGAKALRVPTNNPWDYEVQVEDPDGNVFRFRSDPARDGEVGKWLDGRGDLSPGSAEDNWTEIGLY